MERPNFIMKVLIITLTLSLNLVITSQSVHSGWDFDCKTPNERHVHELFCFRYYQCTEDDVGNWLIQVHSCPLGRIYDEAEGRCVDGSCPTAPPPDCGSETTEPITHGPSTVSLPDPSPPTTPEPSTLRPEPSTIVTEAPVTTTGRPGFKCTEEGVFPDPFDCKLSHTCIPSDGGFIDIPVRCPDDKNFCPDINACGECSCSTL